MPLEQQEKDLLGDDSLDQSGVDNDDNDDDDDDDQKPRVLAATASSSPLPKAEDKNNKNNKNKKPDRRQKKRKLNISEQEVVDESFVPSYQRKTARGGKFRSQRVLFRWGTTRNRTFPDACGIDLDTTKSCSLTHYIIRH